MGVLVGYDDDVERRNTHLIMLPKMNNERLTVPETELLKEIAVLVPAKLKPTAIKVPKWGISRGSDSKLISPRTGATAKQRSVVGESKYGSVSGSPVEGWRDPLFEPIKGPSRRTFKNEKDKIARG